jgi:hypothetical protein
MTLPTSLATPEFDFGDMSVFGACHADLIDERKRSSKKQKLTRVPAIFEMAHAAPRVEFTDVSMP